MTEDTRWKAVINLQLSLINGEAEVGAEKMMDDWVTGKEIQINLDITSLKFTL